MGCEGVASTTPPHALSILHDAFGCTSVGQTGQEFELDASKTTDEEKRSAKARGSSLLYGELLPQAVSKALSPERMGAGLSSGSARILELGMGSGKVALQAFAECPSVRSVIGVEIVHSRYVIG